MLWDAGQRGLCYHVDGAVRGRGTGDAKGTRLGELLHITRRQIGHKLPDHSHLPNYHRVPEFASMCSRALRSSPSIRTASPETAVCTPTSCTDSAAAMGPVCDRRGSGCTLQALHPNLNPINLQGPVTSRVDKV